MWLEPSLPKQYLDLDASIGWMNVGRLLCMNLRAEYDVGSTKNSRKKVAQNWNRLVMHGTFFSRNGRAKAFSRRNEGLSHLLKPLIAILTWELIFTISAQKMLSWRFMMIGLLARPQRTLSCCAMVLTKSVIQTLHTVFHIPNWNIELN